MRAKVLTMLRFPENLQLIENQRRPAEPPRGSRAPARPDARSQNARAHSPLGVFGLTQGGFRAPSGSGSGASLATGTSGRGARA